MSTDFLPMKESKLRDYGLNFSAPIKAEPESFGLTAGDATQIDNAAQDFAAKYHLATDKPTRGAATINDKNNAKEVLIAILRGYGMRIKSNDSVSDDAKINLGLPVSSTARAPLSAPDTRPLINVVDVDVLRHELRFADAATPEKKSKPAGVQGLQVFCQVGEAAPANPLASRFHAFVSKPSLKLDFDIADAGKTAYYYARWQTPTGLVGPWSVMVSRPISG